MPMKSWVFARIVRLPQLLQNCLMLINTVLVEHTIAQHQLLDYLSGADRRALTPLFYEHVNPYGLFALDLDQPSFLEAARCRPVSPPKRWPRSWCVSCVLSAPTRITSRRSFSIPAHSWMSGQLHP